MSPRIGSFDRLLVFERQVETGTDSLGQPVKEWRTFAKAWGSVTQTAEDEAFAASQRYTSRTVTVTTHFRTDIRETDRVVIDGKVYNINGIREIGRREAIEIKGVWSR